MTSAVSPSCHLSGSVLIETSYGNLLFGLYGYDCPQNTKNFIELCALGFYNGCYIPRVVRNGFFEVRGHTPAATTSNATNIDDPEGLLKEQTAQELISKLTDGGGDESSISATMAPSRMNGVPLELSHQLQGGLVDDPIHSLPTYSSSSSLSSSSSSAIRTGRPVTVSRAGLLIMMSSPVPDPMTGATKNCSRSSFLVTTSDRRLDYLDRKHVVLGELLLSSSPSPSPSSISSLLPARQTSSGAVVSNNNNNNNNNKNSLSQQSQLKVLREINALALKGGEAIDGRPIRRVHIKKISVIDCPLFFVGGDHRLKFLSERLQPRFMEKLICLFNNVAVANMCPIVKVQQPAPRYIHNYNSFNNYNNKNNKSNNKDEKKREDDDYFLSSGGDDDENNNNERGADLKNLLKQLKEVELRIKKRRDDETQKIIMQLIGERPTVIGGQHQQQDDVDHAQPPDNVLFVCKLNPLTQDADLAHCFESFGKITSCDIVRDRKTGRSLQYAFIEFESSEACAAAFRKMDRVKIDDSRIHVDFSQSLGRVYWQNKQQQQNLRRRPQSEPEYYGGQGPISNNPNNNYNCDQQQYQTGYGI